jgi:hypothetical protein
VEADQRHGSWAKEHIWNDSFSFLLLLWICQWLFIFLPITLETIHRRK